MTEFKRILNMEPPYQVLSLDAGGIYGLSTAIMLRKLCEDKKKFLNGKDVTLFTGTSIGGLLSLYLASFEKPRDAILNSFELEKSFSNPLLYSNMLDPIQSILSLWGITAWSGKADFKKFLYNIFQDMTLGDLKHRVMITSFNYFGNKIDGKKSGWTTHIFTNFPEENPQRNDKIVDVAYSACSFAGLRPLPGGLNDGGIFSPDPSIAGIATIVSRKKGEQANIDFIKDISENAIKRILENVFDPIIKNEFKLSGDTFAKAKDEIDVVLEFLNKEIDLSSVSFDPKGAFKLKDLEMNLIDIKKELKKLKEETDQRDFCKSMLKIIRLIIGTSHEGASAPGLLRIFESLKISITDNFRNRCLDELKRLEDILKYVENEMGLGPSEKGNSKRNKKKNQHQAASKMQAVKLLSTLVYYVRQFIIKITPPTTGTLENITLLSLGTGQKDPFYWIKDINMGTSLFNILPTNPLEGYWVPPQVLTILQAPTRGGNQGAKALLCNNNFFRLDPPVIKPPMPPVLPAVYYARNPFLRTWIINGVYRAMKSPTARNDVAVASQWLKNNWHEK